MKKRLTALLLASSLILPTGATFAADDTLTNTIEQATTNITEVDPGLTPENNLYFMDQLFENVEIAFTFDPQVKAELYADISLERLAELNNIDDEHRGEFVTTLIDAYQEALIKATEKIEEAKADGEDITDTSDKVDQVAEKGTLTIEELQLLLEQLQGQQEEKTNVTDNSEDNVTIEIEEVEEVEETDEGQESEQVEESETAKKEEVEEIEELLNKLNEAITNAQLTSTAIKDIEHDDFVDLRDQGVGYGKISLTISIANLSGKSVEEVNEMLKTTGVGNVAKQLGLHPGNLKKRGLYAQLENNETDDDSANQEANVETATEVNVTNQASESELTANQVAHFDIDDEDEKDDDKYEDDDKYNEKYAEEMFKLKEKQLEQAKKITEKKLEIAKKLEEKRLEVAKKVAEKQDKFDKKDKEKKDKGNKERD